LRFKQSDTGRVGGASRRGVAREIGAAEELAVLTAKDPEACAALLRRYLMRGSELYPPTSSRFPSFAFGCINLHEADTVWSTIEPELSAI